MLAASAAVARVTSPSIALVLAASAAVARVVSIAISLVSPDSAPLARSISPVISDAFLEISALAESNLASILFSSSVARFCSAVILSLRVPSTLVARSISEVRPVEIS